MDQEERNRLDQIAWVGREKREILTDAMKALDVRLLKLETRVERMAKDFELLLQKVADLRNDNLSD